MTTLPLFQLVAQAIACSSIRFASLLAPRDDEGIHEHARRAVRPLRQLSEVYFQSKVQKGRGSGRARADRSWNIFVHAGTGGDIARDSALAAPVSRTLTKGLSEEPA